MSSNLIATFATVSVFIFGASGIVPSDHLLAQHEISLTNRQPDKWVNGIFEDNILLNMAYLDGKVSLGNSINWDEVRKSFHYEFSLKPKETFAIHEDILPEYQENVVRTTNAHFNAQDGFKSDGYLVGDGVCHLASLIYWVSKDAGLDAKAPSNHDFAEIADIPKEYGVSIYNYPDKKDSNAKQNLYITNNKDKPVTFKFDYKDENIKVSVVESN